MKKTISTKIERLQRFDRWMRKIQNNYYSENDRMQVAYDKVSSAA